MKDRARIAGVLAVGQVLGRGMVAVYTIAMVGLLSRRGYGDLAFAVAVAGIAAAVADGGLSRLIVRDAARSQDPAATARELLKVRAVWVLAVAALTAASSALGLLPLGTGLAACTVAYLVTEALAFGFESTAVGAERPWRFAAVQALGAAALLGALGWVAAGGTASAVAAMGGLCAASAIKVCGHVVVWRRAAPQRGRPLRELPLRRWAHDAAPFLALTVLATFYYRMGIVVMHTVRGPAETAPFAAAFRVFDAVAIAGAVAFAAVSPALSRAHRDHPERIWPLWKRMQIVTALAAVPAMALLAVAAEPLARLLFGDGYAESAGASLRLLAPGMALLLLQSINAAVVLMADAHGPVVRLTALNVAIGLGLTIALVSSSGAEGAAAAMSVAELVSFVSFALLVRRSYRSPRASAPRGAPLRRASGSSVR